MGKEYTLEEIKELVEKDRTRYVGMPGWMFIEQCCDMFEMGQDFLDRYGIKIRYIEED